MTRSAPYWMLATLLLALGARQAGAVWVDTQLTPKMLDQHRISFQVRVKDAGGLKEFEVTVTPKQRKLSPVLTARLTLGDGDTMQGYVPLQGEREDGKVRFWFRVSEKSPASSKFEFGEHGYGRLKDARKNPLKDEWGNDRYIGMPGGQGYWFYLRDFAAGTQMSRRK
jgi:hypothetical protein